MRAAAGIGDHSIKDAVSLNAIEALDEPAGGAKARR